MAVGTSVGVDFLHIRIIFDFQQQVQRSNSLIQDKISFDPFKISTFSERRSERTISRNIRNRIESFRANSDSWLTDRTASLSGRLGKHSDKFLQRIGMGEGRRTESGSKATFRFLLALLLLFVIWLPVDPASNFMFAKTLQVSNLVTFLSIYLIMSLSLNLSTGYTGLLNFGVIFFVSIGAIGVGVLTASSDVAGYGWPIIPAVLFSMSVAAVSGWLLAYPTARLRGDYFAVITISLGEVVRILLSGEPLLKTGTTQGAIGVQRYPQPLEVWWFCGKWKQLDENGVVLSPFECRNNEAIDSFARTIGETFGFGQPAPYYLLLAIIGLICVMIVWRTLSMLYTSPWGRVLRSIREDEDVALSWTRRHDSQGRRSSRLSSHRSLCWRVVRLVSWLPTAIFHATF